MKNETAAPLSRLMKHQTRIIEDYSVRLLYGFAEWLYDEGVNLEPVWDDLNLPANLLNDRLARRWLAERDDGY